MAGSLSNYTENKILDHLLGGGDYTRPGTVYMALSTGTIDDTTTGSNIVEPTYTGYNRVAILNNATNFPLANNGVKSNGTEIAFAECTAGSSTITYFALIDAATAGNVIAYGSLQTAKQITQGDTPKFSPGDLTFTLD